MSHFYVSSPGGAEVAASFADASIGAMNNIRKLMSSGHHKHSLKRRHSYSYSSEDNSLDATISSFAQSLKMIETDQNQADRKSSKRICQTPPECLQSSTVELSPPPPPDHNYAVAEVCPSGNFPEFIPLGDSGIKKGLGTSRDFRPVENNDRKDTARTEDGPPLTQAATYQLRPNFESSLLQGLVAPSRCTDTSSNTTAPADRGVPIPELPFQFVLPPTLSPSPGSHAYFDNRRQQPEFLERHAGTSPKVSADMAVAPLPPSRGVFERANAA